MKISSAILASFSASHGFNTGREAVGTTNVCSDRPDGIYAHPTVCNAFYWCAHGHRFPDQYCSGNLMFNGEITSCDWPENVTCPGVANGSYDGTIWVERGSHPLRCDFILDDDITTMGKPTTTSATAASTTTNHKTTKDITTTTTTATSMTSTTTTTNTSTTTATTNFKTTKTMTSMTSKTTTPTTSTSPTTPTTPTTPKSITSTTSTSTTTTSTATTTTNFKTTKTMTSMTTSSTISTTTIITTPTTATPDTHARPRHPTTPMYNHHVTYPKDGLSRLSTPDICPDRIYAHLAVSLTVALCFYCFGLICGLFINNSVLKKRNKVPEQ